MPPTAVYATIFINPLTAPALGDKNSISRARNATRNTKPLASPPSITNGNKRVEPPLLFSYHPIQKYHGYCRGQEYVRVGNAQQHQGNTPGVGVISSGNQGKEGKQ